MTIYYSKANQPSNTKCPRCKIEMVEGKAIDYDDSGNVCFGFGRKHITNETLKLVECLKCPSCGHSDDLVL